MDYKDTLSLPKTGFPMRANLAQREPELLKRWEEMNLYALLRNQGKGRLRYVLHDGPPYANGRIHMGTALNKVLKDFVVRSRQMMGYEVPFVPGWDCHGLPIELQVDRQLGARKASMSVIEVRQECRRYADHWLGVQREEFKRLGVIGDWGNPYLTMNYGYQAVIVREFGRFANSRSLYKSKKPVYWCPDCRTALAEAEVEYADHTSPSIYVRFRLKGDVDLLGKPAGELAGRPIWLLIWTTTPWTIPANLAIALHPELEYLAVEAAGEIYILAKGLIHDVMLNLGLKDWHIAGAVDPRRLEGREAEHPLYRRPSEVILADYVTLEAGTGLVHTAPGHGREDYESGLRYGLDIYSPVDAEGRFTDEVEFFAGQRVFEANKAVNEMLRERGALLHVSEVTHSYPHCWRCKGPVIFRATEQWFISMEEDGLRERALGEVGRVSWVPSYGEERIRAMLEGRPDWCISRQRSWGVPIVMFYCSGCGKPFATYATVDHVAKIFEKEGADAWYSRPVEELMPPGTTCPRCGSPGPFTKETDILDVWFDSGVSHAAVLERRQALSWPADMYLEGSDQHRGWFQSSLLTAVGTRGQAPYRTVLTHGFVVDGEGRKMSKSLGNVIAPEEVIKSHGAEILRLWVAAEDYRDDIRLSGEILSRLTEAYRRIRNTARFLLGNLADFDPARDALPYSRLPEIDRFALHRLQSLIARLRRAYERFEFHAVYHGLHNFCVVDMSSFYLDVLKDRLYTSPAASEARRCAQTVLYEVLRVLVRLMAPVLAFTGEEIWDHMPGAKEPSVHLAAMPEVRAEYEDSRLAERWERLLEVRSEVLKPLEAARKERLIGHSLEAAVTLYPDETLAGFLAPYAGELATLFIVSEAVLAGGEPPAGAFRSETLPLAVVVEKARGAKCERCWMRLPSVGESEAAPTLCRRCRDALGLEGRGSRLGREGRL
jgi:isoleucyl-tRNA synthetase